TLLSFVGWAPGDDSIEHIKYINSHWSNVEPLTNGFYVNDYFDHTQEQVNQTYRENFPRLLETKKQYDPTNLFRLNANIRAS
ncbi:MAG: BBE domain-containing protein, partial [Woeseiaceae bacterium]